MRSIGGIHQQCPIEFFCLFFYLVGLHSYWQNNDFVLVSVWIIKVVLMVVVGL